MKHCPHFLIAAFAALLLPLPCSALSTLRLVQTNSTPGSFCLLSNEVIAPLWVASEDFSGVARAVTNLQADFQRVSGQIPHLFHDRSLLGKTAVLIGTVGHSPLLTELVQNKKLDLRPLQGQWETFLIEVVNNPVPGLDSALVIAGSDKRGTIYGIYELSEELGVSPWYWWADVPPKHRTSAFIPAGTVVCGPPKVKYRGIFLNDEAPCLTGWANEKFGGYNHSFYTNVFELLLRLKANYLWPAMWNNCFSEDDPLNPILADEYGIVMGTSHVEPMMRADKEWNREGHSAGQWNYDQHAEMLRKFWAAGIERNKPFENIVTMAMRGKIDTPMSETANIALLERIVADQRKILAEVMATNVESVPQLWALYKEVQEYYEKGMRVPDDITLLWCDDNWGNLRRLPTAEERKRSGGAGIYYHFDYVGGPRNYKWLNTVPIPKIWEQMNLAYQYGADRIWIANVGDLKPEEIPMEFFLTLAWDPHEWPKEKLKTYLEVWAEREFAPRHAAGIASLVAQYTKLNGRRKPELLEAGTFSLADYGEAGQVEDEWTSLVKMAEMENSILAPTARDAFYELVQHPVKACAVVNQLYVAVAKNRLYASQGRASANEWAEKARSLFAEDQALSDYFNHTLAGGKWDHMMDQTHIGYTYWQQPESNRMPRVTTNEVPGAAAMGVAVEGSAAAWPANTNALTLPLFDAFSREPRQIEVFNRGKEPFEFSAISEQSWISISPSGGTIQNDTAITIRVDWDRAPAGETEPSLRITRKNSDEAVAVKLIVRNPLTPSRNSTNAFVETDGCVSILAPHFTAKHDTASARWEVVPDLGLTDSSMSPFPVTTPSATPPESPRLEYRMWLFSTGLVEVTSFLTPCLNFAPDRGVRFAVAFDDEPPQTLTAVPKGYFVDNGNTDWETSVKDNVRRVRSHHQIASSGLHTFKVWIVDPGVVLEKIVVDAGGVRPSYLGPPESPGGPHDTPAPYVYSR